MSYKRKTTDEYQIHGDYGQGYEEVTAEATRKAAKEQLACYRENEPGISFRIIKKRVSITQEHTPCPK